MDCQTFSAPRHEGVVHHLSRLTHNLFHPHHRIEAPVLATISSQVCVAPQLETITISTTPDIDVGLVTDPEVSRGGSFGGESSYGHWIGISGGGILPHGHPLCAPELSPDSLVGSVILIAGMLAVIRGKRNPAKVTIR